jgi:uncharacterized alpha/beta hydrolase family protein
MKKAFEFIIIITISCCIIGCMKEKVSREERQMQTKTIQEVQTSHTPDLMSIPGVVGTAIGEQDGKPCIVVMVIQKTNDIIKKIPVTLEGFPVVIKEVGEIRSLNEKK